MRKVISPCTLPIDSSLASILLRWLHLGTIKKSVSLNRFGRTRYECAEDESVCC